MGTVTNEEMSKLLQDNPVVRASNGLTGMIVSCDGCKFKYKRKQNIYICSDTLNLKFTMPDGNSKIRSSEYLTVKFNSNCTVSCSLTSKF